MSGSEPSETSETDLFEEREARVVHDGGAVRVLRLVLTEMPQEGGCQSQ